MFHNLIFDWSGTLVDDLPPVLEATNHVLGIYGVAALDREGFRLRFRLPYREFYEELLPGVPLDELEVHFRKAFAASEAPVTILPHAREKLEWCRDHGVRAFVLTSMDSDAFRGQLRDLELADFFEATYSGVLDKRERILGILEAHRLNPAESAFIGDMIHDIDTARHGNLTSIAVLTGYTHAGPLAAARPDLTVPDLAALRRLMTRPGWKPRPAATVDAPIDDDRGLEPGTDRGCPTSMADSHHIEIRRLRIVTRVGVPDEERAAPQELRVSLTIAVATAFAGMEDDLARTLDYAALATGIQSLAASRPRRLIETLAADIAGHVLEFPVVRAVEVVVEKFILPDTDCVAVRLRREKPAI